VIDGTPPPAPKRQRKGPRPKHIPVRTCAVCRDQSTKRALTRIVRQPDGQVIVDLTGRLNGRGTYICDKPKCREIAANSEVLAKALNATITPELREQLRQMSRESTLSVESAATENSEVTE
jgi:predicted RNA-binding protein YlxR (DUF448 family)